MGFVPVVTGFEVLPDWGIQGNIAEGYYILRIYKKDGDVCMGTIGEPCLEGCIGLISASAWHYSWHRAFESGFLQEPSVSLFEPRVLRLIVSAPFNVQVNAFHQRFPPIRFLLQI